MINATVKKYLSTIGRKGGKTVTQKKLDHLKRISTLKRPNRKKKSTPVSTKS